MALLVRRRSFGRRCAADARTERLVEVPGVAQVQTRVVAFHRGVAAVAAVRLVETMRTIPVRLRHGPRSRLLAIQGVPRGGPETVRRPLQGPDGVPKVASVTRKKTTWTSFRKSLPC